MKNKLFDNHVKEQLAGLSPQVPPHIWENIVAEKDRKKPAGIWGFFTGLNMVAAVLLVLVAGSLVWFFTHNTETTQPDSPVATNTPASAPAQNKNNTIKNTVNVPGSVSASNAVNENKINNTGNTNTTAPQAKNNGAVSGKIYNTLPKSSFAINSYTDKDEITKDNPDAGNIAAANESNLRNRFSYAQLLKTIGLLNPGVKMPLMPRNLSIPCPKAERDAAGNKKYVEVYGGPDYSFSNINDTGAAYAQQRRTTAKTTIGYSAGIRYTRVFNNGMSLRTGINYSRINENFTSVQGHVTHNVYITDNAGDTTGTYSVTGTQYKRSTNKFTTIDIPLMAGYEAGNGRLHTNINAGVMVNITSRESGFVEDKNGNPVDITTGKEKSVYQYKTNTGLSLAAAVSVYYKLNDRLHLMAEPYFRYSLSPVTQSTISLKQKYHTAGLRLGVRVDL